MMKKVALVYLGHVLPVGGGGSVLGGFVLGVRPTQVEGFHPRGCVRGLMSGH